MSDIFNEVVDLDIEVSEMASDAGHIVKLNKVRVQELLDEYEDEKPQFPILRIESGVSGNGNNWPVSVLESVCEQINSDEKPGYWGHIRPEDRSYVFPDPETLWLGATIKAEGGKNVLYVKGYNLPGSKARRHRSLAKVTSWAGKGSGKIVNGVRMMEKFALESIDWARPGAAGMSAHVVGFATEMEGSENQVDWSKITLADIERENPSLLALMQQKVEGAHKDSITEMEADAEFGKEAKGIFEKLREALGVDEKTDLVATVTEMKEQTDNLSKTTLQDKVKGILGGKLKSTHAQAAVGRMIDVTEMEGLSDEDLASKVDEILGSDADIKAVITEMEQAPAPLPSRRRDMGEGSKVGASGMVTVGSQKL